MKKRFLPIPLILLTLILLLIAVIVAGVYRFSLSDEEILAKYSTSNVQDDEITQALFSITTVNPVAIPIPNTPSFAFMESWGTGKEYVMGSYDSGSEHGTVSLDTRLLLPIAGQEQMHSYASIVRISNSEQEVFNYLALFQWDEQRARMAMTQSVLLGQELTVESIALKGSAIEVQLLSHTNNESFAEAQVKSGSILFSISDKYQLVQE